MCTIEIIGIDTARCAEFVSPRAFGATTMAMTNSWPTQNVKLEFGAMSPHSLILKKQIVRRALVGVQYEALL